MGKLLTAAEMREIEDAAIESGAVSGSDLMERAGAEAVAACLRRWPDFARGRHGAAVLCGPGNNGGDGFVVARLLAERGWDVAVHVSGPPGDLPPDARRAFDRWAGMGDVAPLADAGRADGPPPDLWVDAVFGTGLSRPPGADLRQALARVLDIVASGSGRVVALDMPSGVHGDSGQIMLDPEDELDTFQPLLCDLTVAFHSMKPGHVLAHGPVFCGSVEVVDIGLGDGPEGVPLVTREMLAFLQKPAGHKFDHGHALILSGGVGRGGAARIAARSALRAGAGLVTLGCPPAALVENAAQLDAIMLREVGDADDLGAFLADGRLRAIGLGPGLGLDARAGALVARSLASGRAAVLDADALTLAAGDPALRAQLHAACVLTPHGGEFARLFPDLSERLSRLPGQRGAMSKIAATREAAERAGCIVLLKGPDTVIAAPGGRILVHSAAYDRAAPWLATAGSGDSLTGMVTGLLARGLDPLGAAGAGAWLHVECARAFGPGLIAEDLADQLPKVYRSLLA